MSLVVRGPLVVQAVQSRAFDRIPAGPARASGWLLIGSRRSKGPGPVGPLRPAQETAVQPTQVPTYFPLLLVMMLALSPACQRRADESDSAEAAVAPANGGPLSGSDSGPEQSAVTDEPHCGMAIPKRIELIPMFRNRLVVSRTLRSTRLIGPPRLITQPGELESHYVAESSFEPNSLPVQVQRLRGARVRFVNEPACSANVGGVSAIAWADGEGRGWKPGDALFNSVRAFRDGDSFLVADLETDCIERDLVGATGSLPAYFHVWQVRVLSEEPSTEGNVRLMQKGLAALETAAALAHVDAAYARFRRLVSQPLPERWWFLPRSDARWSLATDGDAALLLVELQSRAVVADQQFVGRWLGIWCIGRGGRLESLGVDFLPDELADTLGRTRNRLYVAGAPNEFPLILYAYHALQADSGRYRPYEYALAAPVRLE